MSPSTNRRVTVACGVLLCVAAVGYFAACRLNYGARHAYVRPVQYAVEQGRDPYAAARAAADDLAGGQMYVAGWFAGAVLLLGGTVTWLAIRRAT
jgi:hypothetical protein